MGPVTIAGALVVLMGLLALLGEPAQTWIEARRLSRHTCPTTCEESGRCRCGCRAGVFGVLTGTRCAVCGTDYDLYDEEGYTGPLFMGGIPYPNERRTRDGD